MSAGITLSGITINAPNAIELAHFYAHITDGEAVGGPHWARVNGPGGCLEFQRDDDFQTPTWPMGKVPMHLHLDFLVDNLAATEIRVVSAGARRFDVQPNVDHCLVFADPAGHPFCLTTWDSSRAAQNPQPPDPKHLTGTIRRPNRPHLHPPQDLESACTAQASTCVHCMIFIH